MAEGESPTACAIREMQEEAGLTVDPTDLHLAGLVSERAYEGAGHWLMFLYEVTRPLDPAEVQLVDLHDEGRLEWHPPAAIAGLSIPESDAEVIWPLFWKYRGRFFAAHIDCTAEGMRWRLDQPAEDADPG